MNSALPVRFAVPGERTAAALAWTLLGLITAADILTPAQWVLGTLLSAPVALAALGASQRTTLALLACSVGANLLAGVLNAGRDGITTFDAVNRTVSILTVLLVGLLTLRAREANARAARLAEEERRLTFERSLRALVESVSGPLGEAEFVTRAAAALQTLTGARSVEIGAVDRAMLREPYTRSISTAAETEGKPHKQQPPRLNTRLPLEVLTRPPGVGSEVWAANGGDLVLARLSRRPAAEGGGDLLVLIERPTAPPGEIAQAVGTLQPLLDRTGLLDELRLQRAQLTERGEVLRDLVYAFSHDLRTPLMANAMSMETALRGAYGPLPDAYRATLHNGLEANATLLALADQLLAVAKVEGGEPEDPPSDVNLRDVTVGVLSQLQARAEARSITLEPHLSGVRVQGRPHDLRRAVQNLIDNAVKFSPPGGTVRVTLSVDADEAILTVQDDGPGVSASRIPTLFQRFRGGGAGSGTGLGLYLTRRIAQAHGGNVTYARTARAQSTFSLILPRELPPTTPPERP
ncbi:HAMP domain-containing sensor histidine kinase [Deinococcus sp. Arct2-2]|uniref:sensor histidine kinase n=1 Tax=Deinococcus sp. Arct2-2 TaxID=2568653 RepID=UPI001F0FACF5|nr:HAMP domain-containing sensor histidine kinase [Deinococcus sp. Arct2-2]